MPDLDTCKFKEVVIKTSGAMPLERSDMGISAHKSKHSKKCFTIMAKIRASPRFHACPGACKFEKVVL